MSESHSPRPGQITKTLATTFQVGLSSYRDNQNRPYVLLGRVITEETPIDGDYGPKFDLRLFYRRRYHRTDSVTATDKGIRFTSLDLEFAVRDLQRQGKTFAGALRDVLQEKGRFIAKLSEDLVIAVHSNVVRDMYDNPATAGGDEYVDLRKYFIHKTSNEVTPTRRGFKLTEEDINQLQSLETYGGSRCLLEIALDALNAHKGPQTTA